MFSVARGTACRSIALIREQNPVYTVPHHGTYVTSHDLRGDLGYGQLVGSKRSASASDVQAATLPHEPLFGLSRCDIAR
jgi:DNA-binding GntR family transcriptional regulator